MILMRAAAAQEAPPNLEETEQTRKPEYRARRSTGVIKCGAAQLEVPEGHRKLAGGANHRISK